MSSLSDEHLAATVVSLRNLCDEVLGAQGVTFAPPTDQSMVSGRYADVMDTGRQVQTVWSASVQA